MRSVPLTQSIGNIAGPFFYETGAPRYRMGTGAILGSFAIQCVMSLGFLVYLIWLNKQKDKEDQGPADHQEDSATHAFADLTDKQVGQPLLRSKQFYANNSQNRHFRYTY